MKYNVKKIVIHNYAVLFKIKIVVMKVKNATSCVCYESMYSVKKVQTRDKTFNSNRRRKKKNKYIIFIGRLNSFKFVCGELVIVGCLHIKIKCNF